MTGVLKLSRVRDLKNVLMSFRPLGDRDEGDLNFLEDLSSRPWMSTMALGEGETFIVCLKKHFDVTHRAKSKCNFAEFFFPL